MTRWDKETIQDLYMDAWRFWGEDLQFNLATEEVGEFLKALNKYRRAKGKPEEARFKKKLLQEVADIIIVLGQIVTALDTKYFEQYYHYKLSKLETKLDRCIEEEEEKCKRCLGMLKSNLNECKYCDVYRKIKGIG